MIDKLKHELKSNASNNNYNSSIILMRIILEKSGIKKVSPEKLDAYGYKKYNDLIRILRNCIVHEEIKDKDLDEIIKIIDGKITFNKVKFKPIGADKELFSFCYECYIKILNILK